MSSSAGQGGGNPGNTPGKHEGKTTQPAHVANADMFQPSPPVVSSSMGQPAAVGGSSTASNTPAGGTRTQTGIPSGPAQGQPRGRGQGRGRGTGRGTGRGQASAGASMQSFSPGSGQAPRNAPAGPSNSRRPQHQRAGQQRNHPAVVGETSESRMRGQSSMNAAPLEKLSGASFSFIVRDFLANYKHDSNNPTEGWTENKINQIHRSLKAEGIKFDWAKEMSKPNHQAVTEESMTLDDAYSWLTDVNGIGRQKWNNRIAQAAERDKRDPPPSGCVRGSFMKDEEIAAQVAGSSAQGATKGKGRES